MTQTPHRRALGALFAAAAALSVGQAALAQPIETPAILADIRDNSLSAEEIRGMPAVGEVRIVSLADLSGRELQQLQDILLNTEDGFAEVRTAMEANEVFEAELRRREADISDVHAATVSAGGDVTVYTDVPSP